MNKLSTADMLKKKFIGTDDLRRDLTRILNDLPLQGGEVVVTQHGQPQAVLLDLDSYLDLQETIEDLQTPGFIESIHRSSKEIEQGRGLTMEQLKQNLGL